MEQPLAARRLQRVVVVLDEVADAVYLADLAAVHAREHL